MPLTGNVFRRAALGSRRVLAFDLRTDCYEGRHGAVGALSWLSLFGYAAGLPLGLAALLWRRKTASRLTTFVTDPSHAVVDADWLSCRACSAHA